MTIQFEDVSCGYKTRTVLEHLDLELSSGEAVCILGPNGIGKTTVFKTLLFLIEPLHGTILLDGKSILHFSNRERAQMFSYVPQAKDYAYQFTVQEIVLMGRALYIRKFSQPTQIDYAAVYKALALLDLQNYASRIYAELSGGEQQMVLVARAIAQEARFILMDEPASSLDFLNQRKILKIVELLTEQGIGVLMVSHLPDHAFSCCQKVLMIHRDKRYTFGPVADVITNENLYLTYGVDIKIASGTEPDGSTYRTCYLK